MLVIHFQKTKRCTEKRVCPLVSARRMSRRVNRRTQIYTLGTIEFNAHGKNVSLELELPKSAEVGETVTIMINPEKPEEFVYDGGTFTSISMGVIFIVIGILGIVLGLFFEK